MEHFDDGVYKKQELVDYKQTIVGRLPVGETVALPCSECPYAYEKLELIERQLDGEDPEDLIDEADELICACEMPEGWENWDKDPDVDDDAWSMPDSWYE